MPVVDGKRLIGDVENRADAVLHDRLFELCRIDFDVLIPAVDDHADRELGHLPDFLFERHALEQVFDFSGVIAFRTGAAVSLEEFVAVGEIVCCLGLDCDERLESEAQCKTDYPQGDYRFLIYFAVLRQEFRNAAIFFYLDRLFNGTQTKNSSAALCEISASSALLMAKHFSNAEDAEISQRTAEKTQRNFRHTGEGISST